MTQQRIDSALYTTLFSVGLLLATALKADELPVKNNVEFEVTPKQCTTLEQGQDCYVTLNVRWRAQSKTSYCLSVDQTQLQCWQEAQQGHWQQELIINKDAEVILHAVNNDQPSGKTKIKYAWVYQKRISKANLWRMF